MKIITLLFLLNSFWVFAQKNSTLIYDSNGNRTEKKEFKTSTIPKVSNNSLICLSGNSINLAAYGCENGTLKWSTNQTGNSINVSPLTTTLFSVSCIAPECDSSGVAYIKVEVPNCSPSPFSILANRNDPNNLFFGNEVTLTTIGCNTGIVEWSNGLIGNIIKIQTYGTQNIISATCKKSICPTNPSASIAIHSGRVCVNGAVAVTIKNGNWTDPTVWFCGVVPNINNEVYINHDIIVNSNGEAKGIIQGSGSLNFTNSSFIKTPDN